MSGVRVRFAPSPTGPLHIGGVRTALYNFLYAKKHKGKIILRIEDTDQNRYIKGAEEYIVNALKWCGINFDEGVDIGGDYGPYRQSERRSIYKKYAQQLIDDNFAYYAFDTVEELDIMRKKMKNSGIPSPQYNSITRNSMQNSLTLSKDEVLTRISRGDKYVIRIKTPRNKEIKINDLIRGWVVVNSNNIDDKVIFKSDGMPTYHLANVVDDYLMKISHVIRGEEWLPSAPLHALLYDFLGWSDCMPDFAHLPLILRPDGNGKLSKRDGDRLGFPVFPIDWKQPNSEEVVYGYKEKGFLPEAFINMLAFLGWNPGTSQEIFKMEELIDSFKLQRVGRAGAKFDYKKTLWFNQQHLRLIPLKELLEELSIVLKKKNIFRDNNFITAVCRLINDRITFMSDLWIESEYFFSDTFSYDDKTISKKCNNENKEHIKRISQLLHGTTNFSAKEIEGIFKNYLEKNNISIGYLLPLFRVLLSGKPSGPPIFEVAELLGKKEIINRMNKALKNTDLWVK